MQSKGIILCLNRHTQSESPIQIWSIASKQIINYLSENTMRIQTLLSALLLICFPMITHSLYCSSHCISWVDVCLAEDDLSCTVCATSLYSMVANFSLTQPCMLLPQVSIIGDDLKTSSMDLTGFITSNPTPVTCPNYTLSGEYTANDYIGKNYTNIPLNHYALVVRFEIAYIGTWTTYMDYLQMALTDSQGTTVNNFSYVATTFDSVCGGPPTDAIRIKEFIIQHNTSSAFVNFSALTTSTNPAVQYWAVKDLIVAAKMCHSFCSTCFGPNASQCLTCSTGYYLQGNVCVKNCAESLLLIVDKKECVAACPVTYYQQNNSCLVCPTGCLICSAFDRCQAWNTDESVPPNLWKDKIEFWILIIIILIGVSVFLVYKLCFAKKAAPTQIQEKMITKASDDKDLKVSQLNLNNNTDAPSSQIIHDQIIKNPGSQMKLDPTLSMHHDIIFNNFEEPELIQNIEPLQIEVRPRKRKFRPDTAAEMPSLQL